MTEKNFRTFLEVLEARGRWFFTTDAVFQSFETTYEEIDEKMKKFVRTGLVRRLYGDNMFWNEHTEISLYYAREDLMGMLRPFSYSYVSFESALMGCGVFFRDPFCLTVATDGDSGIEETDIGTLHYTHVDLENPIFLAMGTYWDDNACCRKARPHLALFDMVKYEHDLDGLDRGRLKKVMRESNYLQKFRETQKASEELEEIQKQRIENSAGAFCHV
ncbi:MAG: hypothetical protein J6M06_00350 [Synergistaceae bacterium]|nr:hypothetical protein [Synergistaceae bacterium]